MGFKVVLKFSDGSVEEDDEILETEQEANEYGQQQVSSYQAGGEVLNLSNPGDYPLSDDDDVDFEVVAVDE